MPRYERYEGESRATFQTRIAKNRLQDRAIRIKSENMASSTRRQTVRNRLNQRKSYPTGVSAGQFNETFPMEHSVEDCRNADPPLHDSIFRTCLSQANDLFSYV